MFYISLLQAQLRSVLVQSAKVTLDDGLLTGIAQGVLPFAVEAFAGCCVPLCIGCPWSGLFLAYARMSSILPCTLLHAASQLASEVVCLHSGCPLHGTSCKHALCWCAGPHLCNKTGALGSSGLLGTLVPGLIGPARSALSGTIKAGPGPHFYDEYGRVRGYSSFKSCHILLACLRHR